MEITDSLGCKENLSVNLYEPNSYVSADVVSTSDYNGYNISCFGNSDGSVTVNLLKEYHHTHFCGVQIKMLNQFLIYILIMKFLFTITMDVWEMIQ